VMTCIHARLARTLRALWALSCALLLAACGPTTGGTGTGESSYTLADFGASAASICTAPFATTLSCNGSGTVVTDPADLLGTETVVFTGSTADGRLVLTVTGNKAVLSFCDGRAFRGEWGVLPEGDMRYLGGWQAAGSDTEQAAQLEVRAVAGAASTLAIQVLDTHGQVLFGTVSVTRRTASNEGVLSCP
jgi:hypothetical protein